MLIGAILVGGSFSVAADLGQGGPVIATVGGASIHQSTLDTAMAKTVGSETLTNLITQQLLTRAAKRNHVVASSADIESALAALEQQDGITSQAALQQALAQSGMTLSQLQSQLKLQVLAQKVADSEVHVTNAQIVSYYAKNKKSLEIPASVTLSAIFFKNQQTADAVAKKLQSGYSFAQAARSYSADKTTADKGGSMGTFTASELDPATAKAAFGQPIGKSGNPIDSPSGWEILKVTARTPAQIPTLSEVRAKIVSAIEGQQAKSPAALMASLAKEQGLTIEDTAYTAVKTAIENPAPTAAAATTTAAAQ